MIHTFPASIMSDRTRQLCRTSRSRSAKRREQTIAFPKWGWPNTFSLRSSSDIYSNATCAFSQPRTIESTALTLSPTISRSHPLRVLRCPRFGHDVRRPRPYRRAQPGHIIPVHPISEQLAPPWATTLYIFVMAPARHLRTPMITPRFFLFLFAPPRHACVAGPRHELASYHAIPARP